MAEYVLKVVKPTITGHANDGNSKALMEQDIGEKKNNVLESVGDRYDSLWDSSVIPAIVGIIRSKENWTGWQRSIPMYTYVRKVFLDMGSASGDLVDSVPVIMSEKHREPRNMLWLLFLIHGITACCRLCCAADSVLRSYDTWWHRGQIENVPLHGDAEWYFVPEV